MESSEFGRCRISLSIYPNLLLLLFSAFLSWSPTPTVVVNDRWLPCPSVHHFHYSVGFILTCHLFLFSFFPWLLTFPPPSNMNTSPLWLCCVGSVQLADRHPVPQKEAISVQCRAIVVPNRMDLEVKSSYWFSWLGEKRGGEQGANKGENTKLLTPCSETQTFLFMWRVSKKPFHLRFLWIDRQVAGEEEKCMNNKRVGVDFLVLPQLIKDRTCWSWQGEEVRTRRMGVKVEANEKAWQKSKKEEV